MSLINFHKSTTDELLAVTDKVRNLVSHWGEDGRYKEAVLKNVISRFLPVQYSIATGFVVKQTETRGQHLSSKQIDLIIYDHTSPVLFKEGDFVILTPDSVRAIIEVKNNIQNQGLTEVIEKANGVGEFIFSGKNNKKLSFFNGVFSYEGFERVNPELIKANFDSANESFKLKANFVRFKVNHVSLNKDWFIKYWQAVNPPHSLYNIEHLSFSFFISNLMDTLANKSVTRNNFIWYASDKELNLMKEF